MGKVTRIFTEKEISQTREEKEREREKGKVGTRTRTMKAIYPRHRMWHRQLYMVHMDSWSDLSHAVSACPKRL